MVAVCSSLVNHVRTTHCDCNRNGIGDGAASELYTRWRPIWGQCLTRARATAGSGGRVWGDTFSRSQPRGPRTLTYECRARDADTGAGRAGGATDGPAQCSTFATVAIAGWADCNQWTEEAFVGRRLLDECRARDADTGAGRAGVPPMVPPGAVRSSYCVVERPMSRHDIPP